MNCMSSTEESNTRPVLFTNHARLALSTVLLCILATMPSPILAQGEKPFVLKNGDKVIAIPAGDWVVTVDDFGNNVLVRSVGQILQHLVAGKLLKGLREEWRALRERGKIKPGYETKAQQLTCLQEMLEFLEKDIPDDVRFNALKHCIFYC